MHKMLIPGIAVTAILSGAIAGYRLGAGTWPGFGSSRHDIHSAAPVPATERKVLYWKDPDGKADYSATPKTTTDGRAYVAVYEEDEAGFKGAQVAKTAPPAKDGARKILYYRNPMGLPDTSPIPKKDWMGMDYI